MKMKEGIYISDPETGELIHHDGFHARFPLRSKDIEAGLRARLKARLERECRKAGLDPQDPDIVRKAKEELERIESHQDLKITEKFNQALRRMTEASLEAVRQAQNLIAAQLKAQRKP